MRRPSPNAISSKARVLTPTSVAETQGVSLQSKGTRCPSNAQIRIESIASQIDDQLSSPPASLSSRLRFECISPDDFASLMKTPTYKSLEASDSHVRFNYNSATRVLIVKCIMNPVHDAVQSFVARTIFTDPILQPISGIFSITSGTDVVGFHGRYKYSRKQPDVLVRVDGFYWPTLVVEAGWSEDYNDLIDDAKLWLLGGQGGLYTEGLDLEQPVSAVILTFFDHKRFGADNSEPIKGDFEVWRRDPSNANKIKKYISTTFFPTLPTNSPTVEFTLEDIVRTTNVPPGQPGDTPIQFHLPDLAHRVDKAIKPLIHNIREKRQNNALKRQLEDKDI